MRVILRAASVPDEAFIRGLIRDTIAIELEAASWPAEIRDRLLDIQTNIRYPAGASVGRQFVIEAEGGPAGWILLAPIETERRLVEIMVRPEMRGKGIGSAAILEVIRSGQGPVVLNVNATNKGAIQLYERLGFVIFSQGEVQHVMKHAGPG
jgi:GNAT superfamily N-acetyltransferase